MTLDEAIKHCEEVIEELEKEAQEWHENQVRKCELIPFAEMDYTHENECKECARDHKQLAEWLKDYKRLKEQEPKRKVGEWIKKNNDYFDWYECSECGYGSDGEMKYNRLCDVRTKFCPDCGSQNLKGE